MFGSLFKSKSSSSNSTKNYNYSQDRRVALNDSDGSIVASGDATINVTDGGAVQNALDFAGQQSDQSYHFSQGVVDSAFGELASARDSAYGLMDDVLGYNYDLINKTVDNNRDANAGFASSINNMADKFAANFSVSADRTQEAMDTIKILIGVFGAVAVIYIFRRRK